MPREVAQFGLPEETGYGFAQAVKVGNTIYVSGQVGRDGDERPADMEGQMRIAYRRIARVLSQFGAAMGDIVDETLYVSDIRAASKVVRQVRADAFGAPIEAASTFIAVAGIGSPDAAIPALVEIKCTAIVGGPGGLG